MGATRDRAGSGAELRIPRQYNAAADFVDRHVAQGRGDNVAFIDGGAHTYIGLQGRVNRAANMLVALGLEREQRVAMIMLDTIDFPAVFWGAIKAGIVPVPINTLLPAEQYRSILLDSRARALIVSAALWPHVPPFAGDLPALQAVVVAGEEVPGRPSLTRLLDEQPTTFTAADTLADETAFWLYSSGSTGAPKGIMHAHSSLMQTAHLYGQGVLGIEATDLVFSAAKLFFAYGLGNAMSFPMAVGAGTVLLAERPAPQAVMRVLREHQPTLFFGVPTLYGAMLADPDCRPENGSRRLRLCVSAGEALPREIGERWRERFGVDILDGVGSTEMLHIFLSNRADDVRYGTSGTPVPGYCGRLVDQEDRPVAAGEIGELLAEGPSAAQGYWNQRERSRQTFVGTWTRTGDKYFQDEDGYYHYCGRSDDMFKVSGQWVSPFEVESVLIGHPRVLEAGVVPAEDNDGLLKPKAFIVLKEGEGDAALIAELQARVKASAGPWKYPRWIEFVTDLPKTATGKIQRFKLRDRTS